MVKLDENISGFILPARTAYQSTEKVSSKKKKSHKRLKNNVSFPFIQFHKAGKRKHSSSETSGIQNANELPPKKKKKSHTEKPKLGLVVNEQSPKKTKKKNKKKKKEKLKKQKENKSKYIGQSSDIQNQKSKKYKLKNQIEAEAKNTEPSMSNNVSIPEPVLKSIDDEEEIFSCIGNKKELECNKKELECSKKLGFLTFKQILSPVCGSKFFKTSWEKKHLLIKAQNKNKFDGILSTSDVDKILRLNNLQFTKNVDVTSYKDGKRETHNPEGRALASVVWDFYNSGSSIRILNPQTFHEPVWKMLASLQESFGSFCGANVYLTPPGTQGFAPHWDDIEAFILQLEGKKRWRVYNPRSAKETLPRFSSGNFGPNDSLGGPVLDTILEPGDVLYFPRGFIHQGEALDDSHSLHITISTFQKNTWSDLLEKLLPAALTKATAEDVTFREGLPRNYLYNAGIAYSDIKGTSRETFMKKVCNMVIRMLKHAPIDEAVDQLAKGFIHDSLPPFLSEDEELRSVFNGAEKWSEKKNTVENSAELTPESRIRLLRKGCVIIVVEEESIRLFHSVDNSREYHEDELKFIEVAPEIAPGVEMLIHRYPRYLKVEDLPLTTLEDRMALAIGLWSKGIVTTKIPLNHEECNYEEIDEDEDDDDDEGEKE